MGAVWEGKVILTNGLADCKISVGLSPMKHHYRALAAMLAGDMLLEFEPFLEALVAKRATMTRREQGLCRDFLAGRLKEPS